MKNKFIFIGALAIALLSVLHIVGYSQNPNSNFSYDAAGNRIFRQWTPSKKMQDAPEKDVEAEKLAGKNGIVVYPNPVQDDYVNISIQSLSTGEEKRELPLIYVLDNSGKVLVMQKPSSALTTINLSAYSSGIYYIRVVAGKEQLYYKITKAK